MLNDVKIYGKCARCAKHRFFISKRTLSVGGGIKAKSRDYLCTPCFKHTLKALSLNQ